MWKYSSQKSNLQNHGIFFISSCAEIIFTLRNHHSAVLSMALHEDQFLASGDKNSVTLFTDIVSGGVVHTHRGQQGAITAISVARMEDRSVEEIASRKIHKLCAISF